MLVELLKIEQYVNMALQYIRLDHIHHDLSFQKISLDYLVSQEIKKQSLFFFEKDIKVDYQIKDIQILTDEKWSAFVIEQILSNALKYTQQGSIKFIMIMKSFIFKIVVLVLKKVIYLVFLKEDLRGFKEEMIKKRVV